MVSCAVNSVARMLPLSVETQRPSQDGRGLRRRLSVPLNKRFHQDNVPPPMSPLLIVSRAPPYPARLKGCLQSKQRPTGAAAHRRPVRQVKVI